MHFTVEHPLGQHGCEPDLYNAEGMATFAATATMLIQCNRIHRTSSAPQGVDGKGGHGTMDPLVALAFCAAVTRNVKLLTHLLVLPYHSPLALAKSVATIDQLSGGRLILGVGSGYLHSEFDALGVDFETRARRFGDTLNILQTLWKQDEFICDTQYLTARSVVSEPKPVQLPHPPLWIGGTTRAARKRAADVGQGWMPLMMSPQLAKATRSACIDTVEELTEAIGELKDMVCEHGRSPSAVEVQVYSDRSAISANPFSAQSHTDYLGRLVEAGVTWFVVRPAASGLTECCDSMAAYGAEVIAQMR